MILLKDIIYLFFPNRCLHCKKIILPKQNYLCLDCSLNIEQVEFLSYTNNNVQQKFRGRIAIEQAIALFVYQKNSPAQTLLRTLKYKGIEKIGEYAAHSILPKLANSSFFYGIDAVVPIPLHPKKEQKRGYNQIALFGTTLANYFKVDFIKDGLIKIDNNKSQTTNTKDERFYNVQNAYKINPKYTFDHQHIVLVDDVITTGATLTACCQVLKKAFNVKISVITIACVP